MKPDRKHLGVRVQQWAIDAVHAVAREYKLTYGEALEKLIAAGKIRPLGHERKASMSRISFQFPSHLAEQVRAHAARTRSLSGLDSGHVLATGRAADREDGSSTQRSQSNENHPEQPTGKSREWLQNGFCG